MPNIRFAQALEEARIFMNRQRSLAICLVLSVSWACDTVQDSAKKDSTKPEDTAVDCEPTDEIPYDGVDQDCDGWDLTDVDGDTYDSSEVGEEDCDDEDVAIRPGANEPCDGIDNDCDGLVDADDPDDLINGYAVYRDDDGDGYGHPDTQTSVCEIASGWTTTGGDCNDTTPTVNPAAEEVCEDGVDNNCNGWDAGCNVPTAITASVKFTGEQATDHAGGSLSGAGDLNGDGFSDLVIGSGTMYHGNGAAYFIFGGPPGTRTGTNSLASSDISVSGGVGYDVAGLGDTNGDGFDDVMISTGYPHEGLLFLGSTLSAWSAVTGTIYPGWADATLSSDSTYSSVSAAGDTNGDGFADAMIGSAGGAYHHVDNIGGAYIALGPMTGSYDLAYSAAHLYGASSQANCGYALAGAGDTNGDGDDDVLLGCSGETGGGSYLGAAYVVMGPISGDQSLADADALLAGDHWDYKAPVSGVGDINMDGVDDVLVGDPGADSGQLEYVGEALLYHGPMSGQYAPTDANARLVGEDESDGAGWEISSAGDLNDDGVPDIAVYGRGSVYVVLGPISGTHGLANADFRFDGEADDDWGGIPASAGDFDGDGLDDLLVGAPYESSTGQDAGAAYLIFNTDIYP
jgi:hypothetical protein